MTANNLDVMNLAQEHFTSLNTNTRFITVSNLPTTTDEVSNGNTISDLSLNMIDPFYKEDIMELSSVALNTNWLPMPYLLEDDLNIAVKINLYVAFYGCYNWRCIEGRNGDPIGYIGAGYAPGETGKYIEGRRGLFLSNRDQQNFEIIVTLPKGTNIGSQLSVLNMIGKSIQTQMRELLPHDKCDNLKNIKNFYQGRWATGGAFLASPGHWFELMAVLNAENGFPGLKTAGFQPYALGQNLHYDEVHYAMPLPFCIYGYYWNIFFDFLCENPFTGMHNTTDNTGLVFTSPEMFKFARMLGIPHDIIFPPDLIILDETGFSECSELRVIYDSFFNTNQLTVVEGNWSYDYPKLGANDPTFPTMSKIETLLYIEPYIFTAKDSMYLLVFDVMNWISISEDPKNYVVDPKTKQINVYGDDVWSNTTSNIPMNGYIKSSNFDIGAIFTNGPFLKANTSIWKRNKDFSCLIFIPDYYLENAVMTLSVDTKELWQLSGTLYDNKETNILQVVNTVNSNPFGTLSTAQNLTLEKTYDLTNEINIKWDNDAVTRYSGIQIIFAYRYFTSYSASNLVGFSMGQSSLTSQPTTYTFKLKWGTQLNNMRFKLTDEFGNVPSHLQTYGNVTPFSILTFMVKIFPATGSHAYSNTLLPPPRMVPFVVRGLPSVQAARRIKKRAVRHKKRTK